MSLTQFREIWLVDFEFHQPDGERPEPLCMVAIEWRSGRCIRLWRTSLVRRSQSPFPVGPDTLLVAYLASAELSCFLALGWPVPMRILDLYVEFRCLTCGLEVPCGNTLLGALAYYGLDAIEAADKEAMRALAQHGGPYTNEEINDLLDYCATDVEALRRLLPSMLPKIDVPCALLRGRYMTAVARMERTGVPIDTSTLTKLKDNWRCIQDRLIAEIDRDFGVYEGRTFKTERFGRWLAQNGIPWPRLESGTLDLSDSTFRDQAKAYPAIGPLRELRHSLSQLRLNELRVGADGRNRCMLSPFVSKTGRNQPSNSRFIFGPSAWLRGLIKPSPSTALAYIDFEQQEFAIAAALSRDAAMMDAYASGDPYLTFAKQAKAVSADATKKTHRVERELFKTCALAVQYGMGAQSLAQRIGQPEAYARELLRLHRETYPDYWRWSDAAVNHAMLYGWLSTVFGWTVHVGPVVNPRSLANFPMQANGAEMLRLACCLATENGISVCAPVHDALLVEGPIDEIDTIVFRAQDYMREASEIILAGFEVRTDAKVVRHPDRYLDSRGERMWETVMQVVTERLAVERCPQNDPTLPDSEDQMGHSWDS